jgi:hypothetical protein
MAILGSGFAVSHENEANLLQRLEHNRQCAVEPRVLPDGTDGMKELTAIRPFDTGIVNLSRNLGLITRASVMGTVFALGLVTVNIMTARPEPVAAGMRLTLALAIGSRDLATCLSLVGDVA